MKPPAFDYVAVTTVDEAVATLAKSDGEGKLIAGGQSLMPMLNFRLLDPAILINISGISDLDDITETDAGLEIGALTRHVTLETSHVIARRLPVLAHAVRHVAHLAIRNRGTIGGSLSHADPAAELPMMAVLLDAVLCITGSGGSREVSAEDFFLGALTTDLEEDEMITRIDVPYLPDGVGWGFEEVARRAGDFALAAAAAMIAIDQGVVSEVRLAVTGVDDTPLRISEAEDILCGAVLDDVSLANAAQIVRDRVNPNSDVQASAEYRRHLIGVLTTRALRGAWTRALRGTP